MVAELPAAGGHVVGRASAVRVVLADGQSYSGTVIERASDSVDLALVQIPARGAPLPIEGSGDLRVGSWVASVGHSRGGIWTFTTGMVSNMYASGDGKPVFQTQIPLSHGSSGGPVVDTAERAVGIVTAGFVGSDTANFAIRIEVALQKLSRLGAACSCLTIAAPAGTPIFVDGAMAGTGPRLVLPAKPRAYEVSGVVAGKLKRARVTFPGERSVDLR